MLLVSCSSWQQLGVRANGAELSDFTASCALHAVSLARKSDDDDDDYIDEYDDDGKDAACATWCGL